MENLEIILSLIATVIGFILSTVTFAVKWFNTHCAKTTAQNCIDIRNVLLGFIAEAEKFLNYTGEEKKAYVMMKVQQFADENKVSYNSKFVMDKIDEIIALTKIVNAEQKPAA